jgi:hypothetical protein
MAAPVGRRRGRHRTALLTGVAIILALVLVVGGFVAVQLGLVGRAARTTPVYEPPVLAGQQVWGFCAGGFYGRLGDTIVLTSSGHCAAEGSTAYEPDGSTVRGVFGPTAWADTCPHAGYTCKASDMNYLVVAPDRIPWGRLNLVDMGAGGYRVVEPGAQALSCADIGVGDAVEINGRDIFRSGAVAEKGEYRHDPAQDSDYYPCMVVATGISAAPGDSGGAVLVRGLPAGVTSRSFGGVFGLGGGAIGFTPLAEGLDALGIELCTAPDCGLEPPG